MASNFSSVLASTGALVALASAAYIYGHFVLPPRRKPRGPDANPSGADLGDVAQPRNHTPASDHPTTTQR